MFWMETDDGVWHRYFTDAWTLHWSEYTEAEKDEVMEEDFEEGEFDGTIWKVRDLAAELGLINQRVIHAENRYLDRETLLCGQLKIVFENKLEVILNDFGDDIDSELLVLKHPLTNNEQD